SVSEWLKKICDTALPRQQLRSASTREALYCQRGDGTAGLGPRSLYLLHLCRAWRAQPRNATSARYHWVSQLAKAAEEVSSRRWRLSTSGARHSAAPRDARPPAIFLDTNEPGRDVAARQRARSAP